MRFTDQKILDAYAKRRAEGIAHDAIFLVVCMDVLGCTPVDRIILDMTEFNAFETRYLQLIR